MEKYNKLLRNITELIEKGLLSSKDLKKEVEDLMKFKMEIVANKLNLVSREEFEVQKKTIEKLQKKEQIKKKINRGKEILTRSPFNWLFPNEIFPPWERIMSLAIESPNPTPDLF